MAMAVANFLGEFSLCLLRSNKHFSNLDHVASDKFPTDFSCNIVTTNSLPLRWRKLIQSWDFYWAQQLLLGA